MVPILQFDPNLVRLWRITIPELSRSIASIQIGYVSMSARRLIINADDFGFSPGVTEGMVQAFQGGVTVHAA